MESAAPPAGKATPARDDPVRRAVRGWLAAGHLDAGRPILVACSGGADSLALAAAVRAETAAVRAEAGSGRRVAAAVIDHGLQAGSARVAADAARALGSLGYDRIAVRRVTVTGAGGMEAAARDARYAALADLAHEPALIGSDSTGAGAAVLIAHTADDQAETVLLGLSRGSGPRSIAGMRPWHDPWGRPLLAVRRTDSENLCAAIGLTPWHDPQNADPAFTRVRLRTEAIPLLADILGGVVPALARTAELAADDLDALDRLAERALADCTGAGGLDCRALAPWPRAVRRRVLRRWITDRLGTVALTYRHLVALDDLVIHGHSRQAVRLPGAVDVTRAAHRLHLPDPPAGRTAAGWQA